METIIEYLKRNLREAGSSRWEAIAEEAGVAKSLPRKIAYDDRDNPRVETIQPLLDFFHAVDRGERELPEPAKDEPRQTVQIVTPTYTGPDRRKTAKAG